MIDGLGPHLEYRETDVPWLGRLPAQWRLSRLKSQVQNVVAPGNGAEARMRYIALEHIESWTGRVQFARLPDGTDSQFKSFQADDVLFGKLRPYLAKVTRSKDAGVCVGELLVLRPCSPDLVPAYLEQLLRSKPVIDIVSATTQGAKMPRAEWSDIGGMQIPLPPPDEQTAIVRFLDHADRLIRRYIAAKRELLRLLEEQRQAEIRHAVMRGLDKSVLLKPSGVGWLGEVPSHWQLKRVKQATTILRGKFTHRPRNDPALYDGPYPFIQTGDVARATRSITSFSQTLNDQGLAVSKMFPKGTLVMAIAANIGHVAVLDFDACFPDSVVGFVPGPGVERDFLFYVFAAMKPELVREAPVNTQGNLNIDRVGSRAVAIPPLAEQHEIVQWLDQRTASLERELSSVRVEVSLVREFRSRLVADVITGQLDVREAAASLSNAVEDVDEVAEGILGSDMAVTDAKHDPMQEVVV